MTYIHKPLYFSTADSDISELLGKENDTSHVVADGREGRYTDAANRKVQKLYCSDFVKFTFSLVFFYVWVCRCFLFAVFYLYSVYLIV